MTVPVSACIAFVAGEASGDLLAAPLVEALARCEPRYASAGVAGERMIAAGCVPWHHVRELSVRGYWEVLSQIPRLLRLRSELAQRLRLGACAALVGVDAPDFNLALETAVRRKGVPTIHYVSPSIWAWRGERIDRIRKAADRILLVFPFEQQIYDRAGIAATYVGHPLASIIPMHPDRAAARARIDARIDARTGARIDAQIDITGADPLICLMPGSRRDEIACIAPVFLQAAALVLRTLPAARFVLPVADTGLRAALERLCRRLQDDGTVLADCLALVDGHSHDCLEACDAVLVASGTATLEAALYKRPMVIAYRMPALSAWIMRRIGGYLPWVGLPNILAGESLVPELIQEQASAGALASNLLAVLEDAPGQRRLQERYEQMHELLRRDTPALATEAILHTIAGAR